MNPRANSALLLGLGLAAIALGSLIVTDEPGLRLERFALTRDWQGAPTSSDIGAPQLEGRQDVRLLVSKDIFSLRWSGWLYVERATRYRFLLIADDPVYLRVDGKTLLDLTSDTRRLRRSSPRRLEEGVHHIEIGYSQSGDSVLLRTLWKTPSSEAEPLPLDRLHAHRLLTPRIWLRQALKPVPVLFRKCIGLLIGIVGLALLIRTDRSTRDRWSRPGWTERLANLVKRRPTWIFGSFVVALFALTWLWASRFTAPLLGGDDVLYVYRALFPEKGEWFYYRYVHVYLLKVFIWLRDGDAFLGSRTYWGFLFAATTSSLAVCVRSLVTRAFVPTLAVVGFLLLSQGALLGPAGAAFADYTVMMFVTAAVAIYLIQSSVEESGRIPAWHCMVIGALTLAACKSKETGIILLWLPLLFLWTNGRIEPRLFLRKFGLWSLGAGVALVVVMILDGCVLGDFWYSIQPDLGAMHRIHASEPFDLMRSIGGWLRVVWPGETEGLRPVISYLALLSLAVPIAAAIGKQKIELQLLSLLPILYFVLLIAVHARARHIFSVRYLFPILPIMCLFVGVLVGQLGFSKFRWANLLHPASWMPLAVGSFLLIAVANPLRTDEMGSENFIYPSLVTVLVASILVGCVLAALHPRARPTATILLLLLTFGPGFALVQESLACRVIAQRGWLILYPWTTFRDQIEQRRPKIIVLSTQIQHQYGMGGQNATRDLIARCVFRRSDIQVKKSRFFDPEADIVIAGQRDFRLWRRERPELTDRALYEVSGLLTLIEP